jgi:D-arabinose 1-dehydrogenase-like Zn-dependent alcohol dehydrogenase
LTGVGGVIPTAALMLRQQRLVGLIVGNRQHQIDMVRGIEATGIKPAIERTFALRDIRDSFRLLQSARHVGKICLDVTS